MDPVGAPFINDVQSPSHRQSILGSFLRVRPRGSSQSHQAPPQFDQSNEPLASTMIPTPNLASIVNIPMQPPSPGINGNSGHRRRPAAGALQSSVSHGFAAPSANTGSNPLSHILRRRRSANGALAFAPAVSPVATTQSSVAATAGPDPVPPVLAARPATSTVPSSGPPRTYRIRLVPHLDSHRSLHFDPISRDVHEGDAPLRIGRFTDRSGMGVSALNAQNTNKLAFKSKVVSRAHAEVWCEPGGKFFIKDTKSSSGTFLNHVRLSTPNAESRAHPLKDGDVLQLGVDYQGGTEEIYKCVKMRIELGREWQAQANAFNTNALKQLKALSTQPSGNSAVKGDARKSSISDCCICLFSVTVHQSLFIAPCSHVFHYKCIRPLLLQFHPGFSCPLCRTFANLEEDVEVDLEPELDADASDIVDGMGTGGSGAEDDHKRRLTQPSNIRSPGAMDIDAVANVSTVLAAANEAAERNAMAGVETEVERDFAPPNYRRVSGGATLRNSPNNPGLSPNTGLPPRRASPADIQFHELQEDVDEYSAMLETEAEQEYVNNLDASEHDDGASDSAHPLPALPVPSPYMHLGDSSVRPSSSTAGVPILRPMSVPVHALPVSNLNMGMRSTVIEDYSDHENDAENEAEGFEILSGGGHEHEQDGSGSSGEGSMAGGIGAGGKRKR